MSTPDTVGGPDVDLPFSLITSSTGSTLLFLNMTDVQAIGGLQGASPPHKGLRSFRWGADLLLVPRIGMRVWLRGFPFEKAVNPVMACCIDSEGNVVDALRIWVVQPVQEAQHGSPLFS